VSHWPEAQAQRALEPLTAVLGTFELRRSSHKFLKTVRDSGGDCWSRTDRYAIVDGMNVRDSRVHKYPPRWNAAPSQELLVIRRSHRTGEVSLDPLRWGLIPHWCSDPTGGRKPINAKCETVCELPSFRDAYRQRRCIVPVDGFFEWKAIKGQKAKQPFAIAMKDGSLFGIAGLWENWKSSPRGSGFASSPSSRRTPTSLTFTIACRSFSHQATMHAG
jgi:putative SOS response-associated peptidase YedK